MRLLRSVLLSGDTGLHHKFQRCRAIQTSSSSKNPILIKRLNLARVSKIWWHMKSHAASAPSDTILARKAGKKISRNERRSMLKKYVIKYREMNAGNFPAISVAQKEVGGSYYVVREIIQELRYNWDRSLMETEESAAFSKGSVQNEISPTDAQPKLSGEGISPILEADVRHSMAKGLNEGSLQGITIENDLSKSSGSLPYHLSHKPTSSSTPENIVNLGSVHKSKQSPQKLQPKSKTEVSKKSVVSEGELHSEERETQRKSSVWENLKSFASGILSKWKGS